MTSDSLLLAPDLREPVTAYFEPRAAAIDSGTADIREGLAYVQRELLPDAAPDLPCLVRTLATIAWSDVSSAFSLWSHQMVLAYLRWAEEDSPLRVELIPRLLRADLLGSTGLAPALAHLLTGDPLPIRARSDGDALVLDGRLHWASNLFPSGFVLVVPVQPDDGPPLIVAIPGDAPGLTVEQSPPLLALQGTASAAVTLRGVRIDRRWVISTDLARFMDAVRPTLLLLQGSFSWGLAARSRSEAHARLRGDTDVFQADVADLRARLAESARTANAILANGIAASGPAAILRWRLAVAQIAAAAVALEAKLSGGRGFVATSPTARRLREAAFLPIQSPTEGQLRLALTRLG